MLFDTSTSPSTNFNGMIFEVLLSPPHSSILLRYRIPMRAQDQYLEISTQMIPGATFYGLGAYRCNPLVQRRVAHPLIASAGERVHPFLINSTGQLDLTMWYASIIDTSIVILFFPGDPYQCSTIIRCLPCKAVPYMSGPRTTARHLTRCFSFALGLPFRCALFVSALLSREL